MIVLEAGDHYNRDNYPERPRSRRSPTLYRDGGLTIAEGRPPIPVPVGEGRRRHHGDQLGHLLPRPRAGARATGASASASTGPRDLDADFAEAEEFLRVTPLDPERMGRNGQLAMEGAAALGASGGPISRNAGSCVQCSSCPFGCEIDAKRGMHVSYLPRAVAAGARIRAGVEARPGPGRGRARGRRRAAGGAGERRRPRRAFTVRARRAVIVAGGAFGTPELLLRSGPRRRARSAATSTSTPPAGSAPATRRRCAAGTGVMQSYYVDEWEPQRDPARGDLHPARLRRRLAARRRPRATSGRCSTSATSARSASTSPTAPPAGSGSAATARCGPATS